MELDPFGWDERAQHTGDHSIQSLQEQEGELGHNVPTAAKIFHPREEGSNLPSCFIRNHLIKQIKEWRVAGDRIILFMDHSKHAINGQLEKALADKEGLDLQEAIMQHMGMSPGASFFQGSRPIDGLWISSNLDISNACVMPFRYGIGNHHAFILDIPIKSLVGIDPVKIIQPAGRQLNSRLPGCSKSYINSLEVTSHGTAYLNNSLMYTPATIQT